VRLQADDGAGASVTAAALYLQRLMRTQALVTLAVALAGKRAAYSATIAPRSFSICLASWVLLLPVGELLRFHLQQLRGASLDARCSSAPLLGDIFEPLFVQLQAVGVGLDANLDRPAGLVGVDVVQRRVRRRAEVR
jgi:hypothetical protein